MNRPSDQQAFDEALRRLHIDAVSQVSPRTQAQLRLRQRAAASGHSSTATGASPVRHFGWPVAASCAALLALAFGMQMRKEALPTSAPSSPTLAVVQDDDDTTLAALDESPDFYVWLASNDAADLASE